MRRLHPVFILSLGLFALVATGSADAGLLTFESTSPANNASVRSTWLTAVGTGNPEYLVDFESGFSNGQNISGVSGLFPLGMLIRDTSTSNAATIRSGAGVIGGSNPVGTFSVTQNEQPYLELDFSAKPVDYVGFLGIDQAGTSGVVTFVGGGTASFSMRTTGASGNSAQFFGLYRNDMPRITRVAFDATGDGNWGLDNIEYGILQTPEPSTLVTMGLGLAGFVGAGRVRRGKHSA